MESTQHCFLVLKQGETTPWLHLFRKGVRMCVRTGMSMRELLTEQWDMEPDYVENVVSTVFRNGKPVDDIDECRVDDGNEVALAAAMPGIAGIAMRRNSPVKAYRFNITDSNAEDEPPCDGTVTLRLFNIVGNDYGMSLLAKGVFVGGADLASMIEKGDPSWTATMKKAFIEGREVAPEALANEVRSVQTIYLFIEEEGA